MPVLSKSQLLPSPYITLSSSKDSLSSSTPPLPNPLNVITLGFLSACRTKTLKFDELYTLEISWWMKYIALVWLVQKNNNMYLYQWHVMAFP